WRLFPVDPTTLAPGKVAQPDREEHRLEPAVVVRDPQVRDVPVTNVEGQCVLAREEEVEAAASLRAELERRTDVQLVESPEHDAFAPLDVRHEEAARVVAIVEDQWAQRELAVPAVVRAADYRAGCLD